MIQQMLAIWSLVPLPFLKPAWTSGSSWFTYCCGSEVKVKITQLCPTLCNPLDYIVHGILQTRILKWVAILFSRGSSQTRDRTQVSCIAGRFFTSWATREAQEYWSGNLSLLHQIFLTQELNQGIESKCRSILYQLSYQGIPYFGETLWNAFAKLYLSNVNWACLYEPVSGLSILLHWSMLLGDFI